MKRNTLIPTIIIVLLIFAQGCQASIEKPNPVSMSSYSDPEIYTFEPETFFSVSEQQQEAMFQSISIDKYPKQDLYPAGFFPWNQQDYIEIANVFNHVVASDLLSDWQLYEMTLIKSCDDISVGFDGVVLVYFKFDGTQYATRRIDISPQVKAAQWRGTAYFPHLFLSSKWKSIDIHNFKVSADDALQIAETHGGRNTRITVQNECKILVSIPNSDNEEWEVEYYSSAWTKFRMVINPFTGQYEVPSLGK